MTWFERFGKWFRYELSDFDFLWNILMMACTRGLWFWCMMLYFGIKCYIKKRRLRKAMNEFVRKWAEANVGTVRGDFGKDIRKDVD